MRDPMNLTGNLTSDEDAKRALLQRLAAATAAARGATERYIEIRRECDQTVAESRQLLDASQEIRDQLRNVVSSYVSILRGDGVPPERVIVMVKQAVEMPELAIDFAARRALMEQVVSWAVDAYYAA